MEPKITSHITKGLIISLILVVLDLIAGFANFKFATWFRWIPTLILVGSIIWACINYGSQLNNNVTFGNVFTHGFKTTAVIACIVTVFTVLSLLVIFPETKDIALDQARKQMEAKGNMPEETIDKAIEMTKKFFLPFAIAGAVFGTIIVGAIASLIGAGITKKNPPSPFEQKP
jgi:NADH:ubiquinone oxidoreductase subunit 6 (subunit J)